jgi:hypothetical protein
MKRLALVLVVGCSSACASYTALAPADREQLERQLSGADGDKYLKLSFYVTPFFGDASKKLLTALPPDEVRILNEVNGEPISPGPAEQILPAGTRVHITQVEFPTSWVVTGRVPYSPRTQPWVYLNVQGQPRDAVFVLVLRQGMKSKDDVLSDVERFLAREDPQRTLQQWPESVRSAVKEKAIVAAMPEEALEMAWGYPELKQISFEGQVKKERWVYPGQKRVAFLADGRVTEFSDPK